ncbi:MAG: RNA polymerase sigma factor [Phycisphaerales bacterium]|nr:RNA polymerase sigma factor [Phycisphaerales bacterium]
MDINRTTTAMLDALHDAGNADVWEQFDRRYRPILIGFARNLGLTDQDAADIAQETLARFLSEYRDGRYDREKGRLGAWLVGIARYRILDLRRRSAGKYQLAGESAIMDLDDEKNLSRVWEDERRHAVLRIAMEELQENSRTDPKTIKVFEMLMVHSVPPQVVADELEISVHDVYLAKSRVAQRLRKIVERIESEYDDDA